MTFLATPGGAALITSTAGLLGGSGGGFSNATNKMNRRNQERSFQYTRGLRQTEYQDKMSSLRKAGLNPILAGQYGSTGGGVGTSSSFDPSIGQSARMNAAAGVASSAIQAGKIQAEVEGLENLMSSKEVAKDLGDYFQGYTSNLEKATNTITDGIGNMVYMAWEHKEAVKGMVKDLADRVNSTYNNFQDKIDAMKEGVQDIYINIKNDYNDGFSIDSP